MQPNPTRPDPTHLICRRIQGLKKKSTYFYIAAKILKLQNRTNRDLAQLAAGHAVRTQPKYKTIFKHRKIQNGKPILGLNNFGH